MENGQSQILFVTFKVDFESHRKYITVYVNKIPLRFQFDTASDITLISRSTWERIWKPVLQKTNHIARSAPGNEILLTSVLNCTVTVL